MKKGKFFGALGIIIILMLTMVLIPASPVFGATATVYPTTGKVGDAITVFGTVFTASSPVEVIFSNQVSAAGGVIGTNVTNYVTLGIPTTDTSGTFTVSTTTFATSVVPTLINSVAVTAGIYYIYTAMLTGGTANVIQTVSTFTVVANPLITLDTASGTAGSSVTVTGTGFPASTALVFTFDSTTTLTVTSGVAATTTTGTFTSTVTVPSTAAAGVHTLTAAAGTTTAPAATYTITATPSLDALSPTSGVPGTSVLITGANFPASTQVTVKFDSITLSLISGSSTLATGQVQSTITIPTDATSGAHTITVTAGSTSQTATFTVSVRTATLGELTPDSGTAGTSVTVTGINFPASTALVFTFDSATLTPKSGDAVSKAAGTFSTVLTVPLTAAAGAHTITVTAGTGTDSATFTVTAPAQSINISTLTGAVSAPVAISGNGFLANSTITISYDGTKITDTLSNASGGFITSAFTVPASKGGAHTITISDGTNTSSQTFTVETTPPDIPLPMAPGMGGVLKSPYPFQWKPVTDPSAPVTYDLQVGTSSNFEANSILIDKTGLTATAGESLVTYDLSDAEVLRVPPGVTYYWRERAEDAASNPSQWTSAGSFTVTKPFKFTGMPLYLTMAGAAIVIFFIGFFIGRKSAFNF
jgi:hypothetical protein